MEKWKNSKILVLTTQIIPVDIQHLNLLKARVELDNCMIYST